MALKPEHAKINESFYKKLKVVSARQHHIILKLQLALTIFIFVTDDKYLDHYHSCDFALKWQKFTYIRITRNGVAFEK